MVSSGAVCCSISPRISSTTELTCRILQYSEVDFEEARKTLYTPSVQLASHCPSLRQIRWLDEDVFLVRSSPSGRWRWSDELALEKAHRVPPPFALTSKAVEEPIATEVEEGRDENRPPRIKARRSLFAAMAGTASGDSGSRGRGARKSMGDWEDAPAEDSGFFGSDD